MEPATIVILALSAGVLALLVWFEVNSRRNEARKQQAPNPTERVSGLRKGSESGSQAETENKKAA